MKKFFKIILPMLAVVLEILPFGAVCNFAVSPTDKIRKTFSYFSLIPFGYANFAPFITALLTIVTFTLALISVIKKHRSKPLFLVSAIATTVSIFPLAYGVSYYSIIGFLISIILATECVLVKMEKN